jgi:hypothetical protein
MTQLSRAILALSLRKGDHPGAVKNFMAFSEPAWRYDREPLSNAGLQVTIWRKICKGFA